jgi:hypothetical protein
MPPTDRTVHGATQNRTPSDHARRVRDTGDTAAGDSRSLRDREAAVSARLAKPGIRPRKAQRSETTNFVRCESRRSTICVLAIGRKRQLSNARVEQVNRRIGSSHAARSDSTHPTPRARVVAGIDTARAARRRPAHDASGGRSDAHRRLDNARQRVLGVDPPRRIPAESHSVKPVRQVSRVGAYDWFVSMAFFRSAWRAGAEGHYRRQRGAVARRRAAALRVSMLPLSMREVRPLPAYPER